MPLHFQHRRIPTYAAVLALTASTMLIAPTAHASQADESDLRITYPTSTDRATGPDVEFRGEVGNLGDSSRINVMFAVDLSGSTADVRNMDCNGDLVRDTQDDLNRDGRIGDILDCEIAAIATLNADLRAQPGADTNIEIAITGFGSEAASAVMVPGGDSARPEDLWVNPGLTGDDREVMPNVNIVATGLQMGSIQQYAPRTVSTGTNFDRAISQSLSTFAGMPGRNVLLFISDGGASVSQSTLTAITNAGTQVRTFAVGTGASCAATSALARIAAAGKDRCQTVLDPSALTSQLVDGQPSTLERITVTIDGVEVDASVDAIGQWKATMSGLRNGTHTARVSAVYTDGSVDIETVTFEVGLGGAKYVALGDSYASGEGVDPYIDQGPSGGGKTIAWLCHRSQNGWPTMVSLAGDEISVAERAANDSRYTFSFPACSGARMVNFDTQLQGKHVHWQEPPINNALQFDSLTPDTDLVTVSIGGNDVGFSPIVSHCMTQFNCQTDGFVDLPDGTEVTLDDWAKIRLAMVSIELRGIYQGVRLRTSDDATIVGVTYPRLVAAKSDNMFYATCAKVMLHDGERRWIRSAADTLAKIVQRRTAEVGGVTADVREAFEGNLVCNDDNWIFTPELLRGTDLSGGSLVSAASFHPTPDGVAAYARTVNAAIGEALAPAGASRVAETQAPAADADSFDERLIDDPEAVLAEFPHDVVTAILAATTVPVEVQSAAANAGAPTCDAVVAGERLPVLASGFAPASSVTVTASNGAGATSETTVTTDERGALSASVVSPASSQGEAIEVRVAGTNTDGGPAFGNESLLFTSDATCVQHVRDSGNLVEDDAPGGTLPGDDLTPPAEPAEPAEPGGPAEPTGTAGTTDSSSVTTANNHTPPSSAVREPATSSPQFIQPPVSLGVINNDTTTESAGNKPDVPVPPQTDSSTQAAARPKSSNGAADYLPFTLLWLALLVTGGIIGVRKRRRA